MKTCLECIGCFFNQALSAARLADADEKKQEKIIKKFATIVSESELNICPPEMAKNIYELITKITGKIDPYATIKSKSNNLTLSLYPKLKNKIHNSKDKLLIATELAIAANIIDYGVKNSLNIEKELEEILEAENKNTKTKSKAIFDYTKFKEELSKAKVILYLGDNAGETVFDKILIEEIKRYDPNKKIFYVVKEKPIINDALKQDAIECGLNEVSEIISSGSDAAGTPLHLCTEKFRELFQKADMIISKGQGNFETLSDCKRPIFFLFMAKCSVVANHIRCEVGDIILYHRHHYKEIKTC